MRSLHIYKLVHENQKVVMMTVNLRTMWHCPSTVSFKRLDHVLISNYWIVFGIYPLCTIISAGALSLDSLVFSLREEDTLLEDGDRDHFGTDVYDKEITT